MTSRPRVSHRFDLAAIGPLDPKVVAIELEQETAFMDEGMVIGAQEHEIAQRSLSARAPMQNVMCVTPMGRPITTGEHAAAVAYTKRTADRGGDRARAAPDVER